MEPQQPAVEHADEDSSSAEGDAHRLRNGVIWTVALGVMLLAIGFAVPDLRDVLDRVAHAHAGWLVLAVGLEVASCLGYVAVVRLVIRDARPRDVRRLAWAEQAFGAVVPVGGAGGLAVGAWAMRAWGFSWSRIVNRSAVIFLLTSAVNGAVMVLAGLGVWAGIGTHRAGPLYGLVPAGATAVGARRLLHHAIAGPAGRARAGSDRVARSFGSHPGFAIRRRSRSSATGGCWDRSPTSCSTSPCCGRACAPSARAFRCSRWSSAIRSATWRTSCRSRRDRSAGGRPARGARALRAARRARRRCRGHVPRDRAVGSDARRHGQLRAPAKDGAGPRLARLRPWGPRRQRTPGGRGPG